MLTGIAGALSERQEQFLRTVKRNAGRMTILIADLGELNRIEDGRRAFDMAGFPLKALIEDVLEEQATSLDGRGHQLSRNLPDGLPPVYADQEAVRRVLTRILDNAIRYTPEGGALAVVADYQEHNLQVSVSDNGIGMDQEDQARLFTPFFRSEAEAVREHTGWGLSLALARALVEAQGGALWCDSEVGAGSVFHLTLPAAGGATVPVERK
jgi:signal transduction histidine kinase